MREKHARLKPLPPDIERRLDMVPSVLLRHPVRLAYVFGSAARNPAAASDVDLAVLPDDGFSADALARDLSLRWTVERGLLAGLGLVFQVAEHILAAHFRRFPDTYEGLLVELRDCGVLPEALYARLRGSGGLRNVLVHEYIKVDLKEVEAALVGAPSAFRAFGEAVSAWLAVLPEEA